MALAILASLMMSATSDCASGDCRAPGGAAGRPSPRCRPAGSSPRARSPAAISPSAASRSRSRSRSSSCSTRVRSLKNIAAPIVRAVARRGPATACSRSPCPSRLQPQLGAVRQRRQLERRRPARGRRPGCARNTSANGRPRYRSPAGKPEDPVRLVVDQRQRRRRGGSRARRCACCATMCRKNASSAQCAAASARGARGRVAAGRSASARRGHGELSRHAARASQTPYLSRLSMPDANAANSLRLQNRVDASRGGSSDYDYETVIG